jgi:hypothetical protein
MKYLPLLFYSKSSFAFWTLYNLIVFILWGNWPNLLSLAIYPILAAIYWEEL